MKRYLAPVAVLLIGLVFPIHGSLAAAAAVTVPEQAEWRAAKQVVTLRSGLDIAYVDLGDPAAPPLFLLHGFTDSSRAWSLVAPELAEGRRLIIPDLRGHGDSGKPGEGYTYAGLTGDVIALADALGIARFDLAGHSMGSMVAQHVAAGHPERVDSLTLIASTVLQPIEPGGGLWSGLMSVREPLAADDPFIADWLVQTDLTPARPDFTDPVKAEALLLPAFAWHRLTETFSAGPVGAELSAIRAPVLLLSGEADPLFDAAHLAALDAAFPDSPHCVRSAGGHNLPYEAPAWTIARMRAFLDGAPGNPCSD